MGCFLVSRTNVIPGWSFNGTVWYVTAGGNVSLPGNGHGMRLGPNGMINQTFKSDKGYSTYDYVLTFTLAPSSMDCANNFTAVNVSGPTGSQVFSYKESVGTEMWQTYAFSIGNSKIRNGIMGIQIQSVVTGSRGNITCLPIVDTFIITSIENPRLYGDRGLVNSGFEVGPTFLDNSSQGRGAIELLSGSPSGIVTNIYFLRHGKVTLEFIMGDANDSCVGDLTVFVQMIWDEVGEDQFEREKVLVDLEHECLQVYRRKVDNANMSRARLHQELADSEAQFTHLLLSLDERSLPTRPEKMAGTLKEQLGAIAPALQKMQMRKAERMKQFRTVQSQIQKISTEIAGLFEYDDSLPDVIVNENDLSLKKLEEYQMELKRLHADKSDRLEKVKNYISTIQKLSATLGMDASMIITKVHPSLNELSGLSKNMSDRILAKLNSTVESLEAEKQSRIEKVTSTHYSLNFEVK
ncbi:65-kDa microtubule-associated protein 8 [Tanacetum coccineum]